MCLLICRARLPWPGNGLLRMHTTDPTVPPSFNLVQGKTGGLLTMLGTSGVGNVGKE